MKKKCRVEIVVKMLGSLLAVVTVLAITVAYAPALAEFSNYSPQGLKATTLEEVLVLPDEEIDLATAIMILSKKWDASFDVKESLEEINKMVLEVRALINTEDDPEHIINSINHYLFENKGYAHVDYSSRSDLAVLEKKALPQVIKNKKGDCLGLSLLYLALTERLELPLYGVVLPDHFFVRYDNGEKRINIETTNKGKEYEDSFYEKEFELPPTYRKHDFYLRNLSKKEVIGVFLCGVGSAYIDEEMYDEAIVEYKKAIEINPNNSEAYTNLGMTYIDYIDKEMYDEAIVELKKAIEINPDDHLAHYCLGVAYAGKGMYDEAIAEYKKAVEINPDNDLAHFSLGIAYHKKEMYDEAIVELKKAIEINPDDHLAHYCLGVAYAGKGMYDEAIAKFITAIEINPSSADAHFNLGVTYCVKGKYSLAIEHFDRVIELGSSVDSELLESLEQYREK